MNSKNANNYENVVIRKEQEIGINNFGLEYLVSLEQEIERLNNIINELDTFLKNKIDNFDKDVKDAILHEQMTIRVIYDYLQTVKGDSSNE